MAALVFSFASCGLKDSNETPEENNEADANKPEDHVHNFVEENKTEKYMKSSATCTEGAVYYYACSCGEKGSDTFVGGAALGHIWTRIDCYTPACCIICHTNDTEPVGHKWETVEGNVSKCVYCAKMQENSTQLEKTYTVIFVDESGNPIDGVGVALTDQKTYLSKESGTDGKVSAEFSAGIVSVIVTRVPYGYSKPDILDGTSYHGVFDENSHNLTIVLKTVDKRIDYKVKVVDQYGDSVIGMQMQICTGAICLAESFVTDHNGEIIVKLDPDVEVYVKLYEMYGYTLPNTDDYGYHAYIAQGEREVTVCVSVNLAEHTVKVETVGGMPLEGIAVYVHKGEGYNVVTSPAITDANGEAKLILPIVGDYSVQLAGAPDGYDVRSGATVYDRYPLTALDTVIRLSSAPVTDGGFKDVYELGDVMYDFTLTDINGDSYTLSELLKTKDMVMLKFWYTSCSYCFYEFPYVNSVYDAYKDDIEILAINDYPYDSVFDVANYGENYFDERLTMPLFKVGNTEDDLTLSRFSSQGYPTTVIIDRYGVITMIEVGAMLGEYKWKNIFDHFIGSDYKQTLITDPNDMFLTPTVQWTDTSAQEIANAFNSGNINATYYPDNDPKSWPFVADIYNDEAVIRPSNVGAETYAILYVDVQLKPGQAIMLDWLSSLQNDNMGRDVLYIIVDGVNMYSISGISTEFEACCVYVDPRPLTDYNKDIVKTYTVAFVCMKNMDSIDDDTIYLKNLRVVSVDEIDVETYIFRYAATDLNETEDGYDTYVDVYLAPDGYYRVGDPAKGTNNPLLLANHLEYTRFDPYMSVSERLYDNDCILAVNGVNKFNYWLIYSYAASNSEIFGCTPVTAELKEILVAYCDKYADEAGKVRCENLWLQLCVYYDAYGYDKEGDPTAQLADPIKGLTSFSAFDVGITKDPITAGDIVASVEVTYNKVIMPRGYLYKFVPNVSGVYRIVSYSDREVDGWIFIDSEKWADQGGDRTSLTTSETVERIHDDFIVNGSLDRSNVSMVAYMEAGKEYFIDIAYAAQDDVGTFTFDIKWEGETFDYFIQASPGPITYIESIDGSIGQLIAAGIDFTFVMEDSIEYAYHVLERDENGNPIRLGSKIYADFYFPTQLFPTQSIEKLIYAFYFNFTIDDIDREALILLDYVSLYGKSALINKWINDGIVNDIEGGEKKWNAEGLDAIVKDYYDGKFDGSYSETAKEYAIYVMAEGILALKARWGAELISTAAWKTYDMDNAIRGIFFEDASKAALQQYYLKEVNSVFDSNWEYYRMDDVMNGIYHKDAADYTDAMVYYASLMDNDPYNHPERQGCVAVTRELAEILDAFIAEYVFEDVKDGWLKFCYYYNMLGA